MLNNKEQATLKWPSGARLTKYLSNHRPSELFKRYASLMMKAQLYSLEEMYNVADTYRNAADDILKWAETNLD